MLSYQHSYHAGNMADIHKHLALVILLGLLQQKSTPLCYVDCHAGRGIYDLQGDDTRKTGEAEQGILRLLQAEPAGEHLAAYRQAIAACNPDPDGPRFYPGSAALASHLLREQDRAILMEQHPQEVAALKRALKQDRRLAIHQRDCYEGLPALIPPPIKRGLVLLDPSYEQKNEYADIAGLLQKACQRWSNAVYVLWYPLLAEARHQHLLNRLRAAAYPKSLNSEFIWPGREGGEGGEGDASRGMQGSGLWIVNTPWQFAESFSHEMQEVCRALGLDASVAHRLVQD